MTEAKTKPYAPRVVSEGDIPVHKTLGRSRPDAQRRNTAPDARHCDPRPWRERRG